MSTNGDTGRWLGNSENTPSTSGSGLSRRGSDPSRRRAEGEQPEHGVSRTPGPSGTRRAHAWLLSLSSPMARYTPPQRPVTSCRNEQHPDIADPPGAVQLTNEFS